MNDDPSVIDPMGQIAEEFLTRFRNGECPAISEYISRYPEMEDRIREMLPVLVMMEKAGSGLAGGLSKTADHISVPTKLPIPKRIGGYDIVREIGRGGMGIVYEAEQLALGRRVALKVLQSTPGNTGLELERFRREAKVVARLHHTNIVPVFEVGEDEGIYFYAMQYIHGQSLDRVLDQMRLDSHKTNANAESAPSESSSDLSERVIRSLEKGFTNQRHDDRKTMPVSEFDLSDQPTAGSIESREETVPVILPGHQDSNKDSSRYHYFRSVARVGIQVADALAYAHNEGVLHRDIKPSNLILDTHSRVWITDFGLAKTRDMALTQDGDIIGTVRYMAPERFRGKADTRSDIYSLGLTLYEMLAMRPAFHDLDRMTVMHQVMHGVPPHLRTLDPDIPLDLETIISKSIEKDPGRRYGDARELEQDLLCFVENRPIRARRISLGEKTWRWCQRNPVVASLVTALFLIMIFAFLGIFSQWRVAVANEQVAKKNADDATRQRDQAKNANDKLKAALDRLQRVTYVAHMNLAHHAWQSGGVARVRDLLEEHRPGENDTDLRGFEWYYLEKLTKANPYVMNDHHNPVISVAYSPDDSRIASVGMGKTVRMWNAQTGKTIFWMAPHGVNYVQDIAFKPDGSLFATCSVDKLVKLWDSQTGKNVAVLKGHKEEVYSVAFHPDGQHLVSVSGHSKKPGQMIVWDLAKGQAIKTLDHYCGHKQGISFSAAGDRCAVTYQGNQIKVLDTKDWSEIAGFEANAVSVFAMSLSPNGELLAVSTADRTIQIRNPNTGELIHKLKTHDVHPVWSVTFSPDGKRLATGSRSIYLWDCKNWKHIHTLDGHQNNIWEMAYSNDGKKLVSCSQDETVRIWNADHDTAPLIIHESNPQIVSMDTTNNGKYFATSAFDRMVRLWRMDTGELVDSFHGLASFAKTVAFSPDGKLLAAASMDRIVRVWSVPEGKVLAEFKDHNASVLWIAFSVDGKNLWTFGLDRVVSLWNIDNRKRLSTTLIPCEKQGLRNVLFSPDRKRLVTTHNDKSIRVWNINTGQEILQMTGHGHVVNDMTFHPDGKTLATASMDRTIRLWNVDTGEWKMTLNGHTAGLNSLAFSPDGDRLASVAMDRSVRLWELETGQETLTFQDSQHKPTAVHFSPDGHRLLTGWDNGSIRIWSTK